MPYVMKTKPGNGKVRTMVVYELKGGKTVAQVDTIGRYEVGSGMPLGFDCEKYCDWKAKGCKIARKARTLAQNWGCPCESGLQP